MLKYPIFAIMTLSSVRELSFSITLSPADTRFKILKYMCRNAHLCYACWQQENKKITINNHISAIIFSDLLNFSDWKYLV